MSEKKHALDPAIAVDALKAAFIEDPSYAWSWHCSVACAYMDEGISHPEANRAAARFMKMAFGVEGYEPSSKEAA